MLLNRSHVADYQRDGYVLLENVFTPAEVAAMLREVESGGRVASHTHLRGDAGGRKAGLAIWHELGNDIWAAASTCPQIVNNVRILMGEEVSFFHGKVMLKEALTGGKWEWHQDYGYWYDLGFVFPAYDERLRRPGPGDPGEWLSASATRLTDDGTAVTWSSRRTDRRG